MERNASVKTRTFKCQQCSGEFEFGDDDAAQAESLATFGRDGHDPSMAIVCDDCYKSLMATNRPTVG
jgi:hypothetical protein